MKIFIKLFNFFKGAFKPISLILFFLPLLLKHWWASKKNRDYNKELYKVRKKRDGEPLEKKRKRYNKKR